MKKNLWNKTVLLLFLLLATSWQAFSQSSFKVVGYLPTWGGNVSDVQFSKLTHVNYAFLIPTASGSYQPIENPSKLQSLVSAAHAQGVKVIISVGGGGGDVGFRTIAPSAAIRATFVGNMMNFVNQYNLDGVDIDWEYPSGTNEPQNFLLLMQDLYNALHPKGKLLTAAVIGEGGSMFVNGLFPITDYLAIMAYDDNDFQHSTYDLAVSCMNYWLGRGLPKDKAVLGVPFFGRPGWIGYNELLSRGASPNADVFGNIGYNGIPTIKKKTNLAYDRGGGIMMWDLSTDGAGATSLVSAIHEVVAQRSGDTSTPPPPTTKAPVGKTIWLKGFNGQYVSSENGEEPMNCNRPTVQGWEQFLVGDAGNGKITLSNQGKFVSSENGAAPMNCNRDAADGWEQFEWIANADGTISLKGNNGLFVSSENGTQAMTCNRATAQGWENFTYGIVGAATKTAIAVTELTTQTAESAKTGNAIVYPNPVVKGSTFTVKVEQYDASKPVQVQLVDVNKRVVAYHQASAGMLSIPTGNIASGLYIMTITNGKHTYTKKIIIQ